MRSIYKNGESKGKMKYYIKNQEDRKELLKRFEGKNLNFLIGAGASMPYLQSLSFKETCDYTFEDAFEYVINKKNVKAQDLLSAYFLKNSLIKGTYENIKSNILNDNECEKIYNNYKLFINNIYRILDGNSIIKAKRANIFSTNYDMFLESSFDEILLDNPYINFNDGSVGFVKKIVSTERYHYKMVNVGVDDRFEYELPMINLIKLHGSLNWKIDHKLGKSNVVIDNKYLKADILSSLEDDLVNCINIEINKSKDLDNLSNNLLGISKKADGVYDFLNQVAIVKPRKLKFYETVFEEHYYQSLRLFTQELERNQTILIVFGFSFNDEHIQSIVKRSLKNPGLMIYIFVYRESQVQEMEEKIGMYKNITYVIRSKQFLESSSKELPGDFEFLNGCLGAQDYD